MHAHTCIHTHTHTHTHNTHHTQAHTHTHTHTQTHTHTHLILEHGPSKGPHCSKHKVELIHLLVGVWRGILWSQQGLQQIAQGLDHADVSHGGDLLEPCAQHLEAGGDVAVKENGQVGPLRLDLACVDPTLDIATGV